MFGREGPNARPTQTHVLDQPTKFGPYLLLERISLGGMAEVFKAVEFGVEGFERTVAVKRILPHVAEDEQFIAMFKDEAHIAVQLTHSNIAQIYNLGSERDNFYIALEYVAGRDLRTLFEHGRRSETPMPIGQACYTVMQVCEGLDYAHNKRDKYGQSLNIIHRDVSPPNVLVSYEGEVKLIDFGVAKAAGRVSKTQAGILKGKFGYMSPEQVRGNPVDRRSDVFALTVVLWEVLTGRRLFQGETDFATLDKVREVAVEPPTMYNPKIPDSLEAVVLKGLAEDPEQRYQSAMELHDALQAYMFESGTMYGRKDLAGWMRTEFAREIELEKEKASKRAELKNPGADEADSASSSKSPPAPKSSATKAPKGPPPPPRKSGGAPAPPKRGTKPPTPPGRSGKRTKTMVMTSTKAKVPSKGAPKPPRPKSSSKAKLPAPGAKPATAPNKKVGGSDFDWDDEELETKLFDEETHGLPGPKGAAPQKPTPKKPASKTLSPVKKGSSTLPRPGSTGASAKTSPKTVPPTPPSKKGAETGNKLPGPSPKPVQPRAKSASASVTAPAASATAVVGGQAATNAVSAASPLATTEEQGGWKKMVVGFAGLLGLIIIVLLLFTTGGETPPGTDAGPVAAGGADPAASEAASAPAPVATGGVSITLNVATATVRIDAEERPGKGPTRVVGGLPEGEHKLEVRAEGYLPHQSSIQVVAGLAPSVPVKLNPVDVEIAVSTVPVEVSLKLLADGPATAVKSPVKISRKVGVGYSLEASAKGYLTKVTAIEFDGSRTQQLVIALERDPAAQKTPTRAATTDERRSKSDSASSSATKSAELIIGGMFPGQPPAKISVDGKSYGAKPRVAVKVSAGRHTVKWQWSDGKVATQSVKVGAGDKKKIRASR